MTNPAATAIVRSDGKTSTMSNGELVPGDIVLLDTGVRVPADGLVIAVHVSPKSTPDQAEFVFRHRFGFEYWCISLEQRWLY